MRFQNDVHMASPITVVDYDGDNYYLILEDANGYRHYFHKEHNSVIDGKKVHFDTGEYDGYDYGLDDIKPTNQRGEK